MERQPRVRGRHEDAPPAGSDADAVLEGAVIRPDGAPHRGEEVEEAEEAEGQEHHEDPRVVLAGVHAAKAEGGEAQEHTQGARVDDLHRPLALGDPVLLPLVLIALDGPAEEVVPARERGLPFAVHLLVAVHLVLAREVVPAAEVVVPVAAVVVVVVVVVVRVAVIPVAIVVRVLLPVVAPAARFAHLPIYGSSRRLVRGLLAPRQLTTASSQFNSQPQHSTPRSRPS